MYIFGISEVTVYKQAILLGLLEFGDGVAF